MNILDNETTRIFNDQTSQITPLAGLGLPNVFDAPQSFTGTGSTFNASGITLGWNYAGIGESDIFLGPGTLSGGMNIYALTDAGVVSGSALVSMNNNGTINFNPVATPTDVANLLVTRTTSFTGGTSGYVNAAIRANLTAGENDESYEWAVVGVCNNYASGGQNVGGYFQGNRMTSTTGPTWGAVSQVQEEVAVNNPTTGLIGLEVDVGSNGTDSNYQRIGIDVVCEQYDTSGAGTQTGYGVRVQNNGQGVNSVVVIGVGVVANCEVAFDCGNSASVSNASLRMPSGVGIAFDVDSVNMFKYDGTGLGYYSSGNLAARLDDSGGVTIGGGAITLAGSFSTGTVAPVLTANKPGTGTAVGTWLSVIIDGNQYWLPVWED